MGNIVKGDFTNLTNNSKVIVRIPMGGKKVREKKVFKKCVYVCGNRFESLIPLFP